MRRMRGRTALPPKAAELFQQITELADAGEKVTTAVLVRKTGRERSTVVSQLTRLELARVIRRGVYKRGKERRIIVNKKAKKSSKKGL